MTSSPHRPLQSFPCVADDGKPRVIVRGKPVVHPNHPLGGIVSRIYFDITTGRFVVVVDWITQHTEVGYNFVFGIYHGSDAIVELANHQPVIFDMMTI